MSNAIIVEPLPMATVGAFPNAEGHEPSYVGNDHFGVTWKTPGGQEQVALLIDMGSDVAFDTIALFGLTGAQPDWQIQVYAATSALGSGFPPGSWYGDPEPLLAGSAMPTSGLGKACWLAPSVAPPPPSRFIYIFIYPSGLEPVTVARVVIGKRIQLHRNFQFGAAFGVRDLGSVDFSARGVMLRRRGAKLRSAGISFPHVHRDEVETIVHPLLERIGNTDCVCLVTDPDPHEQRQNRMYFGPLVGDLGTVWARADGFEARVNIVGLDR